jgi:ribonuclease HI
MRLICTSGQRSQQYLCSQTIPKGIFIFLGEKLASKWDINIFYIANEQGLQKLVQPNLEKDLLAAIQSLKQSLYISSLYISILRKNDRRNQSAGFKGYVPIKYEITRQGLSNEVVEVGPTASMHGSNLDIRPPSVLKYNPATIWYTDGSKKSLEGIELVGAGVFNDQHDVRLKIDPSGQASTNTITRAELIAILVTLQQIEYKSFDESIATDSQTSMCMVHKHLYEPHKHAKCKYTELLQAIVTILLRRAKADNHTIFMKVKFHTGIQGNEVADRLAGEATDRSSCDQQVTVGNDGLKDMFWPTKIVQSATHDRPAR